MEKQETGQVKGIRICTLNYIMIIAAAVLYMILIYATFHVSVKYERLIKATEDYIGSEKDGALVREGSDYLTEQARLYVVTMESKYMDAYFTEKNVTKRRERALEGLQKYENSDVAYEFLQKALDDSNRLTKTEIYAMSLIARFQERTEGALPQEIQDVVFLEEDENLDFQGRMEKARKLVFDSNYRDTKDMIEYNTNNFLDAIVTWTRDRQTESAKALKSIIKLQRLCFSFLFVMNSITFILIIGFIIKPLTAFVKSIKKENRLQVTGAYEFKYLAVTYNEMYESNVANVRLLRHKAETDPLTGVLNRGTFETMRVRLKAVSEPLALIIIDIDRFKEVNDTYGHETGDEILKKVANVIQETFRTQDCVARIGGDEFAVIMTGDGEKIRPAIGLKADSMNKKLASPEGKLPRISLSIGVAFSCHGFSKELYSMADEALYRVKDQGRCGYCFYDDGICDEKD